MIRAAILAAGILFSLAATARSDELKLKDGSTIVGTIVAFEDKSFKVQTSYGFAIVQKDQVVDIRMGDAAKTDAVDKSSQSPPKPPVPPTISPKQVMNVPE